MSKVRKIIKHRSPMQTEKSKPPGQWIMPETRLNSFLALSVYHLDGISLSAPETNDRFFLSLKIGSVVKVGIRFL